MKVYILQRFACVGWLGYQLPWWGTLVFNWNSLFLLLLCMSFDHASCICLCSSMKHWNYDGIWSLYKWIYHQHKGFFFGFMVGFFFHFLRSAKVVKYVLVVLRISTFIHILDRKYYISTYHMQKNLFSSTIWQFHPRHFFNSKFFGEKLHNLLPFFGQINFFGCNLVP